MRNCMNEIIGLITARSGSKSIPGKNIKLLSGKPLIAWTIEVAKKCRGLKRIIMSTDDEKIAAIARELGAEVPFIRPSELARDDSSSISAVLHAIHWMEINEGYCPDYVMLLQPTSPFRTVEDIQQCIELARKHRAVAVASVCEAVHHPYDCKRVLDDKTLVEFISTDVVYLRRQDFPPVYALNGAIYLCQRTTLLRDETFFPEKTIAYIMPEERSIDIDTLWDWHMAELIMKELYGHN